MMRRRHQSKKRPFHRLRSPPRESSRISPEVLANPVNQAADWSQDSYHLTGLTERYTLPQVVRCSSRLVPGEESGLPVNVHVPMLLCEGREARKLLARHVGRDGRQRMVETDDTIVIPGDYDGHFVRLQARTTQDKSVARSLHQVALSDIPAFVNFSHITSFSQYLNSSTVSNNSSKTAPSNSNNYSNSDGVGSDFSSKGSKESNKSQQKPSELQNRQVHLPGSVFIVTGTNMGKAKDRRKSRDVVLVRCSDERGHELLVPSDQPGEVVEVDTPPPGSTRLSMLPCDLMASKRYPALVRFVYGKNPPRLTPCSNLFTLIDTFEESSLIGCLLYPNHALMIELPVNSTLGFQVAQNTAELLQMPVPRHALDVVRMRKDTFMRDLKLKVKFLHRTSSHVVSQDTEDDMPSATVRTRQYANEAFFYL